MSLRRTLGVARRALEAGLDLACAEEEARGPEDKRYEIKAGPTARRLRLAIEKIDAALKAPTK